MENLKTTIHNVASEIDGISSIATLDNIKIQYLGKNGVLTQHMKQLANLSPEEKKTQGKELNIIKSELMQKINSKYQQIKEDEVNEKLKSQTIDVTLPAREKKHGSIHPISQMINEVIEVFGSMGFSLKSGPEIEEDFYNFSALNIPDHHPARDMHDTFYMKSDEDNCNLDELKLLRTHTSNVEIRHMQSSKPPFKIIAPGRVYRCDSDMTHSPMFHQVEGLYIDKDIDMGHLKGCLYEFIKTIFKGHTIDMRFRPSYFPFTEPSGEIDISINGSGWLEVLGCGMTHPNVLKNVKVNPDEYQGFAFGIGVERFAMLKYGIKDLRKFFEGDIRFSKQHGFDFYNIPKLLWGN